MEVMVLNNINLNSLNEAQWKSFCDFIGPFVEAYTKFEPNFSMVKVESDGESAKIQFYVKQRESNNVVVATFDKFMCKSWVYHRFNEKIKNIPPHNITLAWQVFLTKSFGEQYKIELDCFYSKNKISSKLINTLIKNSGKNFEV